MTRDTQGQSLSTVTDLDAEALAQAQEMLGSKSPTDVVNFALREVVRRRLAQEYIEFLVARGSAEDPDEARRSAWRPTGS